MRVRGLATSFVFGTLLVAGGLVGCGDDDDKSTTKVDAGGGGGNDSGTPDGSTPDSGTPDAATPVECGGETCTPQPGLLGSPPTAAGCALNAADEEVCGISSAVPLMGAEPLFIEKNAPGVASPSCGAFFDGREPEGDLKGNGLIDAQRMIPALGITLSLQYPGCCTAKGTCSGDTGNGKLRVPQGDFMDADTGFGCMQSDVFFIAQEEAARAVPCDPETGELLLPSGDAGTGDAGAGDAGTDDAG